MPEKCYLCEYKRLVREALSTLNATCRLIALVDAWAGRHFQALTNDLRDEFTSLHKQQRQETEDANVETTAIASPRF